MTKFFPALVAALLSLVAFGASAQERQVKLFMKGNDYVYVEVYPAVKDAKVLPAVTDSFAKAGYIVFDETRPLPHEVKLDSSCDVYIMNPRDRILCRCNSRPGGPQLFVQENVGTPDNDYANVVSTLAKLRDMYHRAIAATGIK